jgi:hypothetical protein
LATCSRHSRNPVCPTGDLAKGQGGGQREGGIFCRATGARIPQRHLEAPVRPLQETPARGAAGETTVKSKMSGRRALPSET